MAAAFPGWIRAYGWIRGTRAIHVSGPNENRPRDAVVRDSPPPRILWLVRSDEYPKGGLWCTKITRKPQFTRIFRRCLPHRSHPHRKPGKPTAPACSPTRNHPSSGKEPGGVGAPEARGPVGGVRLLGSGI